jgi:dihydrolipoamide dehydrogenase
MSEKVDVVIVGSGTAGLSALREVRRETDSFYLINDGSWGTTCASVGCMPSKALIEAANAYHARRHFEAFGITGADGIGIDIPAVLRRVRKLRDKFVRGPESVRDDLGERAIAGRARLLGPNRIAVGEREIEADRIVLAIGSHPFVPEPWRAFGDRILTTDTLFEQEDLPPRVAVIGLGAIGAEMALAIARLGVEVAGFDAADKMAGISDEKVASVFRELVSREVSLFLGGEAELREAGDGISVEGAGGSFTADAVLVALGRRPNIEGLGLETLGVELDQRGMPPVDPNTMRIADLPVYLVGDANGDRAILHEAADEGHIAGRNAVADKPSAYRRRTRLGITFTSPDVARVGAGLAELDESRIAIGEVDFSRQGRARMGERNAGLLRIYADGETGCLRGAEMCVPAGEHMAHLLALAIEHEMTAQDVLSMPFYHPVLEEGLRSGLRELARQLPGKGGSDLSQCPEVGFEALD